MVGVRVVVDAEDDVREQQVHQRADVRQAVGARVQVRLARLLGGEVAQARRAVGAVAPDERERGLVRRAVVQMRALPVVAVAEEVDVLARDAQLVHAGDGLIQPLAGQADAVAVGDERDIDLAARVDKALNGRAGHVDVVILVRHEHEHVLVPQERAVRKARIDRRIGGRGQRRVGKRQARGRGGDQQHEDERGQDAHEARPPQHAGGGIARHEQRRGQHERCDAGRGQAHGQPVADGRKRRQQHKKRQHEQAPQRASQQRQQEGEKALFSHGQASLDRNASNGGVESLPL